MNKWYKDEQDEWNRLALIWEDAFRNCHLVRFEDYKDVVLQDDTNVPFGGTSFKGETLGDFLLEAGEAPEYLDLEVVNRDLRLCGILPV